VSEISTSQDPPACLLLRTTTAASLRAPARHGCLPRGTRPRHSKLRRAAAGDPAGVLGTGAARRLPALRHGAVAAAFPSLWIFQRQRVGSIHLPRKGELL